MSVLRVAEPLPDAWVGELADFLSSASFWTADAAIPDAWPAPSWCLHAPFLFWLTETLSPRLLVTSGDGAGQAYRVVCLAADRLGLLTRCHVIGQPDAVDSFDDASIDLLQLDGSEDQMGPGQMGPGRAGTAATGLRRAFDAWRPKLSSHAVVLLHGITHPADPGGIGALWADLLAEFPGFAFTHGDGLGVLGLGSRLPLRLTWLLQARDAQALAVREAYARLGSAVGLRQAEARLTHQAQALAVTEEALATRAMLLDRLQTELLQTKARAGSAFAQALRQRATAQGLAGELARLQPAAAGAARLAADLDAARQDRAIILNSTCWRLTAPLRRLVDGARRGKARLARALRQPGPLGAYQGLLGRPRLRRHVRLLRGSALLDPAWYYGRYPDVAAAGMDAAAHYLRHGAAEGRDPGPEFATAAYWAAYPDVRALGVNPLVHYLRAGQAEGRLPRPAAPHAPDAAPPRATPAPLYTAPAGGLSVFAAPGPARRVTLLLEAADTPGRMACRLALAGLLAQRVDATLRLVALADAVVQPGPIQAVLRDTSVRWEENVDITPAGDPVALCAGDLFLTTSWRGTRAARHAVEASRIVQLVETDEHAACDDPDEAGLCHATLAWPQLRLAVASRHLLAQLRRLHGPGLDARARCFELAPQDAGPPAFVRQDWRRALRPVLDFLTRA